MKNVKALVWKLRGLSSSFKCLAHYITLALNNIAVFSFPATANPGAPPANELSPPLNNPEDVNGDNNSTQQYSTQQPGSINSHPVQEEQRDGRTRTGEERDQQEETGNTGFILEIG